MTKKPVVYVITGPTASGKSALAVELAKTLQTEIVSADSRQIYKGIPISTAVPDQKERQGINHHLLEKLDLREYYSASRFEEDALEITDNLIEKTGTAVICGGSMLYVDTFCKGIDELPTVSPELRNELMQDWKLKGDLWLSGMLKSLDKDYWMKVDLHNLKRVFHAVEISLTAGKPYSSLIGRQKIERPFEIRKVYLSGERELLFSKINRRVEVMMSKGLLEEARMHFENRNLNSLNTVGLKEIFKYFEGEWNLSEAVGKIQKNTRVYAKKQMTWYKKETDLTCLDMSDPVSVNISKILTF